jgi:hypothetical protein
MRIHHHAKPAFCCNSLLINNGLINQPPVFPQKSARDGNAFFLLVLPVTIQLKLQLLIAQAVNLFGDILIIGSGYGTI